MRELFFLAVFLLFFTAGSMVLAGVVIILATSGAAGIISAPIVVFLGVVGTTLMANEMAAWITGR